MTEEGAADFSPELDDEVQRYVWKEGYVVVARTPTTAQLVQHRVLTRNRAVYLYVDEQGRIQTIRNKAGYF